MTNDLREAIAAAYDKVEAEMPVEEAVETVEELEAGEEAEPEEIGEPDSGEELEASDDDTEEIEEPEAEASADEDPAPPVSTLSDDDSRAYKELQQVLEPYRERHALQGMSSAAAVAQLLSAAEALQRDPVNSLKQLADNLRVDLRQFSQPASEPEDEFEDEFVDPQTKQLQQRVQQLESVLTAQHQQQQQSHQAGLHSEIAEFSSAKSDDGSVLHPHFDTVRPRMVALLQSGAAASLDEAYDSAVWSSPDLRKTMLDQQGKAATAAKSKRVVRSKRAARNLRSEASPVEKLKPRSLRETIEAAYDAHAN